MSEHRLTLVRRDVLPTSEAESIADEVRDRLLAREVIAANDRYHELALPPPRRGGAEVRARRLQPVGLTGAGVIIMHARFLVRVRPYSASAARAAVERAAGAGTLGR